MGPKFREAWLGDPSIVYADGEGKHMDAPYGLSVLLQGSIC